MSSRTRRKILITVVNTTAQALSPYESEYGYVLEGGKTAQVDPKDPITAALIEKRVLHVKEG